MPTSTYIALANITLSASTSSVTFSNISQSYRDLVLIIQGISGAGTTGYPWMRFNNSSSGYAQILVGGDGSTSFIGNGSNLTGIDLDPQGAVSPNGAYSNVINIMDYSNTNIFKGAIIKKNAAVNSLSTTQSGVSMHTGRWDNTAAITSIFIDSAGSWNWDAGTTFSLFGIVA